MTDNTEQKIIDLQNKLKNLQDELSNVIVGHNKVIEQVILCLVSGGHALLQGSPGLGKTLLIKSLAKCFDLSFSRIQFTPDLMPADILGTNISVENESGHKGFEFYKGPIFGNIILADEINRATPKTQSAMLEAMQECKITSGGKTHNLPNPFFVLATQNPIEMEGTYPLPEAQLDRFMFMILVKSYDLTEMMSIIDKTTGTEKYEPKTIMKSEDLLNMRTLSREVPIAKEVAEYASKLVMATDPSGPLTSESSKQFLRYGGSVRAAQSIILSAKVRALLKGRLNVSFEDIDDVAYPALRHRIIRNFECEAEGITSDEVLNRIFSEIKSV